MIVACALSFNLVNCVFFVSMVRALNAAYVPYLPKCDAFRRTWVPKLYETTKEHVTKFLSVTSGKRTLGFDGFKTVVGHVVIIIELIAAYTVMCAMIDPGQDHENAAFYAKTLETTLRRRAADAGMSVEDVFCAIVGDNVRYNRNALAAVALVFPALFYQRLLRALPQPSRPGPRLHPRDQDGL